MKVPSYFSRSSLVRPFTQLKKTNLKRIKISNCFFDAAPLSTAHDLKGLRKKRVVHLKNKRDQVKKGFLYSMFIFTFLDWGHSLHWVNLSRYVHLVRGCEYVTTLGYSVIEIIDNAKQIGDPVLLMKKISSNQKIPKNKIIALLALATNVALVAWAIISSISLVFLSISPAAFLNTLLLVSLLFSCHSFLVKKENLRLELKMSRLKNFLT